MDTGYQAEYTKASYKLKKKKRQLKKKMVKNMNQQWSEDPTEKAFLPNW